MGEREGLILAWEQRLEILAHDVQRTGATGRRVRLLDLVASAIDTVDNKKAVVWAAISLEFAVVSIYPSRTEVAPSTRAKTMVRR